MFFFNVRGQSLHSMHCKMAFYRFIITHRLIDTENWGHAYLFVLPVDEGEFKLELCGVDGEDARSDLPIQTENAVPLNPGDVDGQVQGTDDAMVTEGERHEYQST